MIKRIKDVDIVPGVPVPSTKTRYLLSELAAIESQENFSTFGLINLQNPGGGIHEAAVGKNASGMLQVKPLHIVVIPCPPICEGEGQWTALPT